MEEKIRMTLVSWEQVCIPKKVGGLGLRNMKDFNITLKGMTWEINYNYDKR